MKKSIIFLALLAAFAISFVFLMQMGAATTHWKFWVVLILLPAVGWVAKSTDFRTGD
jgi:hypothetical protein